MSKMNVGKWKDKFVKDFRTKEFLPIKILFFLSFGAQVSMIPFLTLQARSLGISEEEVGIIYSFIPIASLVAPAIAGMLADRIGNFKILLSASTALCGLTALLFIIVPPGRIIHKMPNELPLEVTCAAGSGSRLSVVAPYTCERAVVSESFPLNFEECTVTCYLSKELQEEKFVPIEDSNVKCPNSDNCFSKSGTVDANSTTPLPDPVDASSTTQSPPLSDMSTPAPYKYEASVIITRINTSATEMFQSDQPLCPDVGKKYNKGNNCVTVCRGTTVRQQMCINDKSIEELNPTLTFYAHLFIRLFKEFTIATSMPLFEGAAVTILKQHHGDFGFQRLYSNIGMMIMTPISGTLIDYFSLGKTIDDFRPAMYMYCGLKLMAAFIILFLNLEFKKASTRVIADFSSMILNPEIICFLMATFLAGTCYGYIETFLFWLLEDLGADKQLMGLTLTVGSVFGIPLLMISAFILKKIGHVNTIVVGFSIYIIRLLGYTFIPSPWWAMPFEALECVTVSLMVVSFVSYAAILATPATVVTLQGLYGGLYNGVGRGAGSLIGGFLIERIGIFQTFRVMACIGGVSGLIYFIVNCIFFRNKRPTEVQEIEDSEKMSRDEMASRPSMPELSRGGYHRNSLIEIEIQDKVIRRNSLIENEVKAQDNRAFEGDNAV